MNIKYNWGGNNKKKNRILNDKRRIFWFNETNYDR